MVLALSGYVDRLQLLTQCCNTLRTAAFEVPSWVPELCAEQWPDPYRWSQFAAAYSRSQTSLRAPGTLDVVGVSVEDRIEKVYGPVRGNNFSAALDTIR